MEDFILGENVNKNNKTKDIENEGYIKNQDKKVKLKKFRTILVLLSFIIVGIIIFFINRNQYLNYIDAGSQYLKIYKIRELEKTVIFIINFILVYIIMFFVTKNMQKNLKELYKEEKNFPNLPTKSISFIIAVIISLIIQSIFQGDFLKIFNVAWFGKKDPILNLDYSYYIQIIPIIRKVLIYFFVLNIFTLIYVITYNILTINLKFGGIEIEQIKNSKLLKQIFNIITTAIVIIFFLIFVFLPNIFISDMLKTEGKESFFLTGASTTDIYIKFTSFLIFPFILIFSFFKFKKAIKDEKSNKILKSIAIIPIYILVIYILTFLIQVLWLNRNVLNYEGKYIRQNIIETYAAYDINIENEIIEKSEILDSDTLLTYQATINSIPIIPEEIIIKTLNEQDTNLKMYKYNNVQLIKNYNENNLLAYLTPRELDSKKSPNGSTDYTHGNFGIVTSANSVDDTGSIKYLDKSFENQKFKDKTILEPRIYYGTETNSTIITNIKENKEYDYPITTSKIKYNVYDGIGGLNLKFLDRLVVGIRTSSPNIIFNSKIKDDTRILFNRNIIKRAENILPEVRYDNNPYLVVSDEGRLLWILDGYTTSKDYPYSQSMLLPTNDNRLRKTNYIRNSVKVLVDAYDGKMEFYINKSDPMILSIDNIFKEVFKSMDNLPEDIQSQLRYPRFLYDVQSEIIRKYHTNAVDIFYSGEDVWEFSLLENEQNRIGEKKLNYTVFKNYNEDETNIGYLTIYTPYGRQNINSYLVGTYEGNIPKLKLYEYSRNDNIPGIQFIKTQIMSETSIKEELEELNVIGTEVKSYPMLIPIENSMIYVEPVYQIYVNKNNHAVLKKVIVANGSKVAIGNNIQSAVTNLFTDLAINIDIHDPLDRELIIEAIIRTNTALEKAVNNKNLEDVGRYTQELNSLINQLKKLDEEIAKKVTVQQKQNKKDNKKEENINIYNKVND